MSSELRKIQKATTRSPRVWVQEQIGVSDAGQRKPVLLGILRDWTVLPLLSSCSGRGFFLLCSYNPVPFENTLIDILRDNVWSAILAIQADIQSSHYTALERHFPSDWTLRMRIGPCTCRWPSGMPEFSLHVFIAGIGGLSLDMISLDFASLNIVPVNLPNILKSLLFWVRLYAANRLWAPNPWYLQVWPLWKEVRCKCNQAKMRSQ